MDRLWTPWRYNYVSRNADGAEVKPRRPGVPEVLSGWPGPAGSTDEGCVFCNMIGAVDYAIAQGMAREDAEKAAYILYRGPTCFLCLNAYPYSTGHILILPYRHVDSLAALERDEALEMIVLAQRCERALRAAYRPDGLNVGVNLGEAGGAGIAAHLHMHILPRWVGDANFMTVMAETRVLPEALDVTWGKVREALATEGLMTKQS